MSPNHDKSSSEFSVPEGLHRTYSALSRLAQTVAGHHEKTITGLQTDRLPQIGKISWLQIAHDLNVRITAQREAGAPEGVEISCIFKVNGDTEAAPLPLSEGGESFTITVPKEEGTGLHSYFKVTPGPDGELQAESDFGARLEADDLEAYMSFAETMANTYHGPTNG